MADSAAEHLSIPTRPRLKPWLRLARSTDGVLLRYGASVLELGGGAASELVPRLLPLLDGTRTVPELIRELGEPAAPAVDNALYVLARRGLLTDPPDPSLLPERARTAELLAATDPYGRDMNAIAATLAQRSIAIVGSSGTADVAAALLEPLLETRRTGWATPPGCDLAIVAPSSAELPLLEEWNGAALARGTAWLQVLPFDGEIAAVGPIFAPWESACHECFAIRRSACISPIRDRAPGHHPSDVLLDGLLGSCAAQIALRHVALDDGASVGVLLAVELSPGLVATRHVVHRVPRCPACSPAAARAFPSPWSEVHGIAA